MFVPGAESKNPLPEEPYDVTKELYDVLQVEVFCFFFLIAHLSAGFYWLCGASRAHHDISKEESKANV